MAVDLLDKIIQESGLSPVIGPGVVHRALERAGIVPEQVTRLALQHALPFLEAALGTYLTPEEVRERMIALLGLTRSSSLTMAPVKSPDSGEKS
jgi:hypothetical protein